MPKKLTILGALTALVLAVVGLTRDGSTVYAGIQNFDADATTCYGAAPATGPGLACPGATGTTAATSDGSDQYTLIELPHGSRLTLPVVYVPIEFTLKPPPAVGDVTGDVTSSTDLLCNTGVSDILAGGRNPADPKEADVLPITDPDGPANGIQPWPKAVTWIPYDFEYQGPAPAGADVWLNAVKPMPNTFTPISHDKALLYTLWLNRTTELFLPTVQGNPTPLNLVTEGVPASYTNGVSRLRASATLLAGNPETAPNNSFLLCLDSPQDSASMNNQSITPAAPGRYARFTAFTSDIDERDGNVSRILDLNCVTVGAAPGVDADGDCLTDGSPGDLPGNPDTDGDLVPDGIEALFGTDPNDIDNDNDGATDYDEIFQFTSSFDTDTDDDGQLDRQDNGSDETPASLTTIEDTTADDNCPNDDQTIGGQVNTDSASDNNGLTGDTTNPSADTSGDACDADDDNDGLGDAAEGALEIDIAPNFCIGGDGSATVSSTDDDSDGDLGLDGIECKFGSNPDSIASTMVAQPVDNLGTQVPPATADQQETFYRTGGINIPPSAPSQSNNPDGDPVGPGDNPVSDSDSDNDGLLDGTEVKFYGTHPANPDSDSDGCPDGREAASVNVDRNVSSIDLGQIAQRFGAYSGAVNPEKVTYDYTKNSAIQSSDLGQVAQRFGSCPAQGGITVSRGASGWPGIPAPAQVPQP